MKRPFMRSVSIVAGGTAIAQALNVLFSPVITRIFSPEEIGALGVLTSVVAVLLPLANLSFAYAIVLPKRDEDGARLLKISLLLGFLISILVLLFTYLFKQPIAQALSLVAFENYLFFIPIVLFFTVAILAYDQWLIRKKLFKASSTISVLQSLLSNSGMTFFGYLFPGFASLIGVNIFAQFFHAVSSGLASRKTLKQLGAKHLDPRTNFEQDTKSIIYEYRDFPYFRTPQILINTLSRNLPIMVLTILSGPAASGLYALGQRVLKLPAIIVSESLGKVFQQRVAETSQRGLSLQPLVVKSTILLAVVGIIPFGTVILFGPFLFSLVFGSEWLGAGEFARWMALWLFFAFVNVPSTKAIPLLNMQKELLIFEIVSIVLRVISLIIGYALWKDDVVAIALFSITGAFLNAFLIGFVIIQSRSRNRFEFDIETPLSQENLITHD